jgi:hypothetical protein
MQMKGDGSKGGVEAGDRGWRSLDLSLVVQGVAGEEDMALSNLDPSQAMALSNLDPSSLPHKGDYVFRMQRSSLPRPSPRQTVFIVHPSGRTEPGRPQMTPPHCYRNAML